MSDNQDNNFWKVKIMSFLHDTIDKAFLLAEKEGHEYIAKDLIKKLGIEEEEIKESWDKVKKSDHISAASDRITFPNNINSNFKKNAVLLHPVSSEKFDLGSLQQYDTNKAKQSIEKVLEDIKNKSNNDYKKMFFLLWASLNKKLKKQNDGMGVLWDRMVADTRIPNHTIWHHNRIASAFVGAMYENNEISMILMSIGPVQDFINVARTTADFWAGSYLMSYLSWKGMEVFVDELGPDSIIFPDLKGQPFMEKFLKNYDNEYEIDNDYFNRDILRPSLPNRWLVIAPKSKSEDLAKKAEKSIKEEWEELRNKVAKHINLAEEFNKLKKQNNFLEVYYSILDIPKESSDIDKLLNEIIAKDENFENLLKTNKYTKNIGTYFHQLQKAIEKIMGARKSIRFSYNEPERGYKCTLCGKREVINNDINTENYRKIKDYWKELSKKINDKIPLCIKENEMLCSSCLTKRVLGKNPKEVLNFGRENYHYPSLTEIAVSDFKLKLIKIAEKNNGFKEQLLKFKFNNIPEGTTLGKLEGRIKELEKETAIKVFHIDGEFLFEETYQKEENKDKKQAYDDYKDLIKLCKEYKISKPSPYVGFIYFDGDHMGKWISQTHNNMPKLKDIISPDLVNIEEIKKHFDKLLEKVPPMGPHFQSAISSILLQFSLYIVRYIVETENTGLLIYSGGDDVVAMAPLSEVLKISKRIRFAFSNHAVILNHSKIVFEIEEEKGYKENKDKKELYLSMGKKATGSCGITIAHYHNSLIDSLEKAREAEKYAKNKIKRDSFAINLLKRSGEHVLFGLKWGEKQENIDKINEIINLIGENKLSPAFITQFYFEVDTYWNMNNNEEIIKDRLSYLFNRHCKDKKESKKVYEKRVIESLLSFIKIDPKDEKLKDIDNFKGILSLILFIARNSKISLENMEEQNATITH